ncbi:MAG: DegT/DnrJ/EryC1/StrS family aminotransferase [Verrucomicrobiales bacterium]
MLARGDFAFALPHPTAILLLMMSAPEVPNNDFAAQWRAIETDVLDACRRVGRSGWYVLGREVAAFEGALAAHWGLAEAIGTGNGMDAIEIALRAGGLNRGDRVLTTPFSAFATTLAILRAGGIPVFVDTDASGLIDLDLAESILDNRPDIRWMVPVHLYGHSLDMRRLQLLARRGVRIVEDCAQSIGASYHGTRCGTAGIAATVSFYPTKNLGALGDGGALLTDDPLLATASRQWRDYGQSAKYEHSMAGLNSRLDEWHAAILSDAMLPRLDDATARRRAIAARYLTELRSDHVQLLPIPPGSESVWHLFPVRVRADRPALLAHLANHGIQSAIHYPAIIPDQPAMSAEPHECASSLDTSRQLAQGVVSLPVHPWLSEAQIDAVVGVVNTWHPVP